MQQNDLKNTDNYKEMTYRAILSIALFVFVYIILIILAIGLTIICGYAGIMLIYFKPMAVTFFIGAGLVSMGILVLVFLLKYFFKKHIADRSNLIEILEEGEPKLFEFINDIVKEADTRFPKKIFISPDVNASVFYDSSFWSMFFPIRKNLNIGLGLVDSVSVSEFKAIIAHEFGHFSQKTMSIGSYVYNVNQVIYNMLYDNKSYDSMAEKWSKINTYFSLFVSMALIIVTGIQKILKEVYRIVNLKYLSLSRQMEFQADEIAANIAGSQPLIVSLLRLDLADNSYNAVLDYYNNRISNCIKTENIYPQHQFVLEFLAKENKLKIDNNLPEVPLDYLGRYNKSKLVIKDQWASHPSTADRIAELKKLNVKTKIYNYSLATSLFQDLNNLQKKLTSNIFSTVTYSDPATFCRNEQFIEEYTREYKDGSFDDIYNGYYDNKNPNPIDINEINNLSGDNSDFNTLFNNNAVDLVYTSIALTNDINFLKNISQGIYKIKIFDYDGKKYSSKDCTDLIAMLEKELKILKSTINENDLKILNYFYSLAKNNGKENEFKERYEMFLKIDGDYDHLHELYTKMADATDFIQYKNTLDIIEKNLIILKRVEAVFKKQIENILKEGTYQQALRPEIIDNFTKYISKDWIYFNKPKYDDDALGVMYSGMRNYAFVISRNYFNIKKNLLNYQTQLTIK